MVGGACNVSGPAHHLETIELVVHPSLLEQLGVCSLLNHLAAVDDGDGVGVVDGGETVSYDDTRSSLPGLVQSLLHYLLTLCVQGRGGLVQEEEFGVANECTSDGNSLLLTARQLRSLTAYISLVALREVIGRQVVM